MGTKTIPDYPRGITFEQVWAALMEDRERIKKMEEAADRRQAQWEKEAAERQAKLEKEAAERQAKLEKEAAERQAKWESEAAQRQKDAEQRQKEAEQRQKEFDQWHKETERIVRRNSKQMGDLHRRFGELAEHLVAPNINRRFNDRGHHEDRRA